MKRSAVTFFAGAVAHLFGRFLGQFAGSFHVAASLIGVVTLAIAGCRDVDVGLRIGGSSVVWQQDGAGCGGQADCQGNAKNLFLEFVHKKSLPLVVIHHVFICLEYIKLYLVTGLFSNRKRKCAGLVWQS